jgi:tRNA nucleotidyltransferase (CCA-adding enzyme)
MPVTTLTRKQAFEELRSNLELTGLQETTVATRQNNVRTAVASQLSVVDDFLTGSYRRHTMIGPLKSADVDVLIVLDRGYKDRGPRAVLELVKKTLLDEYKTGTQISRNGQAVTITFSDFIVDVVPAFVRPWWTWDDGWDICDS